MQIAYVKDGWIKLIEESETNMYQYAGARVVNSSSTKLSDNDVENYLNSQECDIKEVLSFIEKYNEIVSDEIGLKTISRYSHNY